MTDKSMAPAPAPRRSPIVLLVVFAFGALTAALLGSRRRRSPAPSTIAYERQLRLAQLLRDVPILKRLSRRAANSAFSSAESEPQVRRLLDFWSKDTRKVSARRDDDTGGQ